MTDVKLEAVAAVCRDSHNRGLMWVVQAHPPTGTQLCTIESAQQAVALRDVQRDFDARLLDAQGKRIAELEAALRQCVDALNEIRGTNAHGTEGYAHDYCITSADDAITKAQWALK